MSDVNATVLIDWKVGLDFCKTHSVECDLTRSVLREVDAFGVDIHMRKRCWEKVTDSLVKVQTMLEYLRDRASEYIHQHSEHTAIERYNSDILVQSTLTGELNFDPDNYPNIETLRTEVADMGLRKFRIYLDNHLSLCTKAQTELDLMVKSRYTPSGSDPFIFESSLGQFLTDDENVQLLVDAYKWASASGDFLITRNGSEIYNHKVDIEDIMESERYEIMSPVDIRDAAV